MTEQEWETENDPSVMVKAIPAHHKRKLRLFLCAKGRELWRHMTPAAKRAIERAEQFADGEGTRDTLELMHDGVGVWTETFKQRLFAAIRGDWAEATARASLIATAIAWAATSDLTGTAMFVYSALAGDALGEVEADTARRHCGILRDLFGPLLFREVRIDPAWVTWNGGAVRNIAAAVYEDRAFDRMPILADALEDAGCDTAEILAHCRSGGTHYRGCWVIDLLTGRD
jgi:hypothetical protein